MLAAGHQLRQPERCPYCSGMARCAAKRVGVVALGLLTLLLASPARANVTGEVYQDAKAVIEDLLSAEIARALVPQVVCRGGRREELASPSDCRQRVGEADHTAVCLAFGSRYVLARMRLLEVFPATLQALYSRRFAGLGSTVTGELVEQVAETFYHALRSDLAVIERELAAAKDPNVRLALQLANHLAPPTETVLEPLPPGPLAACVAQVDAKLRAGVAAGVAALDSECAPPTADNALACELAQALREALSGHSTVSAAHSRRALALPTAQALLAQLALSPAAARALARPLADEVTALVAALERDPASPALAAFAGRAHAMIEHHCARHVGDCPLQPAAPAATAGAPPPRPIDAALAKLEPALRKVVARVRAATAEGATPLTVRFLVTDVLDVITGPDSLCEGIDAPACSLFAELEQRVGKRSLLWPAVRAASSGDLRAVAHLALSALFGQGTAGRGCDRQSDDEGCRRDAFRRFADSLVMYVLDVARGDTSEAVRAVFRQAAAEAIRLVSPFGGLDRAGDVRSQTLGDLLWLAPELALRPSWSPGYVNDEPGHLRYTAGLQLVRLRKVFWYTDRSYAALGLSLLDPLAPLAEIVLRADRDAISGQPVRYRRSSQLLWNVLTPRLEWNAGLPWLSKHVVLGAGLALRLVTATERSERAEASEYTYRLPGAAPWYEHLELALSLKYLP